MTKLWLCFLATMFTLSNPALCQTGAIGSFSPDPISSSTARYEPFPRFFPAPVLSAPYYGEEVVELENALADGSLMRRSLPSAGRKVWRDSQGRSRVERPLPIPGGLNATRPVIEITDPVAGFFYALDTENRLAHREKLPPSAKPRPQVEAGFGDSFISLGKQVIEGEFAEGTKFRFEIGKTANGQQPVYSATEKWFISDLKIPVMSRIIDPVHGTYTQKLLNIIRREPEPKLFDVPSDYKIVDETGPFEIKYSGR